MTAVRKLAALIYSSDFDSLSKKHYGAIQIQFACTTRALEDAPMRRIKNQLASLQNRALPVFILPDTKMSDKSVCYYASLNATINYIL